MIASVRVISPSVAAVVLLTTLLAGTTVPSALFVVFRARSGWSAADVGLVFAAYIFTLLPVLVLFGGLSDRIGRRTSVAAGFVLALAGLLALLRADSVPYAVAARLLQGMAVGIASGSLTAAISQTDRGRFSGGALTTIASNLGLLSGAVVTAIAYHVSSAVTVAIAPMILATIAGAFCIASLPARASRAADGIPYDMPIVVKALAFALPATFVGWSGISLFLSMVPTYLAAALGVHDPLLGAGVIAVVQLSSIAGTIGLRSLPTETLGIAGPIAVIVGLVILVAGVGVGVGGPVAFIAIALASAIVGAGGGCAFSAGIAAATTVSRGQRARIFAWVYVAAYLGFGAPSWSVGVLAGRTSFAAAFIVVIVALGLITTALPVLGRRAVAS